MVVPLELVSPGSSASGAWCPAVQQREQSVLFSSVRFQQRGLEEVDAGCQEENWSEEAFTDSPLLHFVPVSRSHNVKLDILHSVNLTHSVNRVNLTHNQMVCYVMYCVSCV